MKSNNIVTIGLFALALSACGSGSNSTKSTPTETDKSAYQGVWLAPAYGQGLSIVNNQLTLFDYTADYCFINLLVDDLKEEELRSAFELQNSDAEIEQKIGYGANGIYAPGVVFSKEIEMPPACLSGFMPQVGDANYTAKFDQDLEYFYQTFKELSVSIELQQLDWENMYMSAEQALAEAPTDFTLIKALIGMIEHLKDGHTSLGDDDNSDAVSFSNKPYYTQLFFNEFMVLNGLTQIETEEQQQAAYTYLEDQAELLDSIITNYAGASSAINIAANDRLMWFQLEGIGYLQVSGMEGFSDVNDDAEEAMEQTLIALEKALDHAVSDLQNTKGLIIDIRRNFGGHDFISLAIASRFIDQDLNVYQKQARLGSARTPLRTVSISPRGEVQYLNPIVLLTSASTLSAAEVFSMAMANLPHVTLMGEATQGEFSDVLEKKLPIGIPFTLSNEYYLTVDGKWLEGEGVPVGLELPSFVLAERLAGEDLTLEAAFEFLTNQK